MSWEGGGRSTSSSSAADGSGGGGGGGGGGRRKPSCGERENNRRRERRRRAVASKIYRGLRAEGNYNLPKHSDNNQVLKALCNEVGWIVEPDGTTYRKGFKPAPMETGGTSTNITPSSSRNPSPPSSYFASPIPSSYQQSPSSSSFPSPSWLDANTSLPSFAFLHNSIPSSLPPLRISNSAPVTPPLSSPTRLPNQSFNFKYLPKESVAALNIPFFASSAPGSPTRWQLLRPSTITECDKSNPSTTAPRQWMNFRAYGNASDMVPPSPTFNLVRPMAPRVPSKDAMLEKERGTQFDFEKVAGKPWEGERIHEVGLDDLELTLGSGSTQN